MLVTNPKEMLESIELIRAVKSLFVEQNPYLPMYSALGGAFIGAIATFVPNYLINNVKESREKKSMTLQLYAEIKAVLAIIEHRKYIDHLQQVVNAFASNQITSYSYQVQIRDEAFPIFKNSLDRLGILDIDVQVRIVEFYQLLDAVIQDIKPGGLLNAQPAPQAAFVEDLRIAQRAKEIGAEIVGLIEERYQIPNSNNSNSNN